MQPFNMGFTIVKLFNGIWTRLVVVLEAKPIMRRNVHVDSVFVLCKAEKHYID